MTPRRIVIIGAALAGATAAVTLRSEGFDGEIELVGAEPHLPYNRPPLSKGYLRGEERFEDQLVNPAGAYAEKRIAPRLGVRATAIDAAAKRVQLDSGERIAYDRLLVATGGRNRTLAMPGSALAGVLQLRTVEDCDRIRAAAQQARRVVVVGLGFIGAEVAASLRQLGVTVTLVGPDPAPLARVLGREVGDVLGGVHRDKGVELVPGESVAAFEGTARVERVLTASGRRLDGDLVVAGIGIVPNTELLAAAGARVDNGVLVDEHCRTSLPDVYAAGDVTNHQHPVFGRLRVEHWNNALRQGQAAARAMLGDPRPYDYVHTFWSDQYEHSLQYVGFATSWDRLVFRGRPRTRRFLGFYVKEGLVRAAVGFDRGGDPEAADTESELKSVVSLIGRRLKVQPEWLEDEDVDLRRLAETGSRARS